MPLELFKELWNARHVNDIRKLKYPNVSSMKNALIEHESRKHRWLDTLDHWLFHHPSSETSSSDLVFSGDMLENSPIQKEARGWLLWKEREHLTGEEFFKLLEKEASEKSSLEITES